MCGTRVCDHDPRWWNWKNSQTSQICFEFHCEKSSRCWTSGNLLCSKTPISRTAARALTALSLTAESHAFLQNLSPLSHPFSSSLSRRQTRRYFLSSSRAGRTDSTVPRHAYSRSLDHSAQFVITVHGELLRDSGESRWARGTVGGSHSSSRYRSGRWWGPLPDE